MLCRCLGAYRCLYGQVVYRCLKVLKVFTGAYRCLQVLIGAYRCL